MIGTSATFINGGEHMLLNIPKEPTLKTRLNLKLEVIFEDDHLAAIHKPAGILVSGNSFKTVSNALPQNLHPSQLPDATIPKPVHRLDYATTGILLVGKTNSSIRALNKMFEERKIEKTYHAITIGAMNKSGCINSAVDGKPSESHYSLIKSVVSKRFGQLNWVELKPKNRPQTSIKKAHGRDWPPNFRR